MNKVFLIGRLTADLRGGIVNSGKQYVRFSLAVNGFGGRVDYINVVAWEKTAEAAMTYLSKGKQVAVEGSIQTGSYEYQGEKRLTFDVRADRIEFIGNKSDGAPKSNGDTKADTLQEVDEDDDMPF